MKAKDGEEDSIEFLRGVISDLMNEMIRSLERASFMDQFMQPREATVLQSFLRNGGSRSQSNKMQAAKRQLKKAAKEHSIDIRSQNSLRDTEYNCMLAAECPQASARTY